jgi:hypothetical protein
VIASRRWAVIARRRWTVVAVSPRIGLGGTAEHADACPDGSAGASTPAAADDAANDGSHCRALNSALHYLRRGKCARPNTGPAKGQPADQNGEYAVGCHEIPPLKALDLRAALRYGPLDEITMRLKVDVGPRIATQAGIFSLVKNTSKILTACFPMPSRISLAPAASCRVHGHNADTSVMSLGPSHELDECIGNSGTLPLSGSEPKSGVSTNSTTPAERALLPGVYNTAPALGNKSRRVGPQASL